MNWKILLQRSHVPYSANPNACYVKGKSGCWYPGVRIENISFPLTISALQAAIFNCLSQDDSPVLYNIYNATGNIDFWENEFDIEYTQELPENVKDSLQIEDGIFINKENIRKNLHEILPQAVTPYSNFPVSALLETADGFINGVNIEVSEWSLGLCAERVALAKAFAYGNTDFQSLHVHTSGGNFSSPCGACRQVIIEHLPQKRVHFHHPDGTQSSHRAEHLLPFNFNAELNKSS